jgi:hypothetical protein
MLHANVVSSLLTTKLKAMEEFLLATESLRGALERDDMSEVGRLIGHREDLIAQIERLDRDLLHYKQTGLEDRDATVIHNWKLLFADLVDKLNQVQSADRQCNAVAACKRNALKKEIADLRQNGEGLQHYVGKPFKSPRFVSLQT